MIAAKDAWIARLSETEWHCVVLLLLFTSGLISAALALDILKGKGNDTAGIFTLGIAGARKRALPSIPEVPFTTVLGQAETVLPGLPSSIISQVKTAVGSIETAVSGAVPQNITLGTKRFCLIFPHRADCQNLPVSLSPPLSSTLDSTTLKTLDHASTLCDPKTMEALLVVGIVFCFAMMVISLVLRFNSSNETVLQRGRCLLLFLSLTTFVLFLVPAVVWLKVNSMVSRAMVDFKEGSVPPKSVAMVVCAALSVIFNILYLILLYNSGFI